MDRQLDEVEAGSLPADLEARARRFASLRAARRALAAANPSEIESANRAGRSLLVELEKLEVDAATGRGSDLDALRHVDGMLDEESAAARATLHQIGVPGLHSALGDTSRVSLTELRALVDLLLEPVPPRGHSLRILEYLVTLASSEERLGRRVAVREPSGLTERLTEACRAREQEGREEDLEAERRFRDASLALCSEDDLDELRDRMRSLKLRLEGGVLHPAVLASAVSYNVAMWNRVADLTDASRSIDLLAEHLLDRRSPGPSEPRADDRRSAGSPRPSSDLLSSEGISRLVTAVGARLRGEAVEDGPASRCAAGISRHSLRPLELESFESGGSEGEEARLVRFAVVLALAVRKAVPFADELGELGLDKEALRTEAAPALADRMAKLARELFGEGRHSEAFALSEVRSRYVAGLIAPVASSAGASRARVGRSLSDLLPGIRGGSVAALVTFLVLVLAVGMIWSPRRSSVVLSREEVEGISPFLYAGHLDEIGGRRQFNGRLAASWDYLEPHQRMRVAHEIALVLEEQEVAAFALKDRFDRVYARYAGGRVELLDPSTARGAGLEIP